MLRRRSGNIFAMIFGGIVLVGVLGVAAVNLVITPMSTSTKISQSDIARNDLLVNAKLIVMNAATRPQSGDEDGDGYVEPVPFIPTSDPTCTITLPNQGGCLPRDVGAILSDPWGTPYAYCVWDHGNTNTSANRIQGANNTSGAVLAVISAGPNKRFETPCRAYANATDNAINPLGEGDDLVEIYTYAGAVAGAGGLWQLKDGSPSTAVTSKNVEVSGAFRIGQAGENTGEVGSTSCANSSHIGRMRFNAFSNVMEVCTLSNSMYIWSTIAGGGMGVVEGQDIAALGGGGDSCVLDVTTVPHGGSHIFFSVKTSTNCASQGQSRSCNDGTLSGGTLYRYSACAAPLPCTEGPVGTICSEDGARYAGTVNGVRFYMPSHVESGTYSWNNGTNNYEYIVTSDTDGKANTDLLAANTGQGAPYAAARACKNKYSSTGTQWYLPSKVELETIYANKSALQFNIFWNVTSFWSSSSAGLWQSWSMRYGDGYMSSGNSLGAASVLCVRR